MNVCLAALVCEYAPPPLAELLFAVPSDPILENGLAPLATVLLLTRAKFALVFAWFLRPVVPAVN